ncbi:hypothetical protein L841_0624 [Mycobacterium sp. MAC_080597_8934]|nr:hypothetical protein L841_0624 [Mycobacterium sp. MAC_080597_8934]
MVSSHFARKRDRGRRVQRIGEREKPLLVICPVALDMQCELSCHPPRPP